jgi:hypothetical protein
MQVSVNFASNYETSCIKTSIYISSTGLILGIPTSRELTINNRGYFIAIDLSNFLVGLQQIVRQSGGSNNF